MKADETAAEDRTDTYVQLSGCPLWNGHFPNQKGN